MGWWPGEGNANDIVGTNNGVLQGGATATNASFAGQGFTFDGTNSFVQIADSPVLKPTNLTVEAWVRFASLDSAGSNAPPGDQYIVFKQNSQSGSFEGYDLSKTRVTGGDTFRFLVSSASGQSVELHAATLVSTGAWYHLAAVRGSNFTQLYVNGQLQRQTNVSFPQDYGAHPLYFGTTGQSSWDRKLKGSLDEVSLYNRALTSNEIAAIYAAGAAGKCGRAVPPAVTNQPQSLSVVVGSNASFSVKCAGTAPLNYQWTFQDAPIVGATNSSLTLTNAQLTNGGNYIVVVTNFAGTTTSAVAVLSVLTPPVVTVLPQDSTNAPGTTATFSVTVGGSAPFFYPRRHNGAGLIDDGRISGSATATLAISNVQPADFGAYGIIVSNAIGAVTSAPAMLTVSGPPAILTQPVTVSVVAGTDVSFSVFATGTQPLAYQWEKDGVALTKGDSIINATGPTLTLANVQTNEMGNYQVTITNGEGSATSSMATLVVAPQPSAQSAGAVVLVNSSSPRHLDFQHYLQPYLDNFGVPYTVLDITSNSIGVDIGGYSLIIIGHALLDTNRVFLNANAQSNLVAAVANGTGLVNFDGALSLGGTNRYQFAQSLFGFSYGASASSSNVAFPATEALGQNHYITALHQTNESFVLSNNITVTTLGLPADAKAVALVGGKPLLAVRNYGTGRVLQWSSYDWMQASILGPVNGFDDLVWRGLVWAARKPFVIRGRPNFVTMRVDDASGPFTWVHTANSLGFKPYLALFFSNITGAAVADLRGLLTNGSATASIHSFTDNNFFYYDHDHARAWPDDVMSNNYAIGTQWYATNGIPISKMMIAHWSEMGSNSFAGLKAWGIEYVLIEIPPGVQEYITPATPWLVAGPYRLYDTPQAGDSTLPLFYADFLKVPGHPEFDGQFFDPYTEIRDVGPTTVMAGGDWAPDISVAQSIDRGTKQIKRGLDSKTLGNVFTHERYITAALSNGVWLPILQGLSSNLAGYNPIYVTMDYANQYLRATRTSRLMSCDYDAADGQVVVTFSGKTDMDTKLEVYTGVDSGITNSYAIVPAFAAGSTNRYTEFNVPPAIATQPQDQVSGAGSNATFIVVATGTAPLAYSWQFNGTNLPNATNASLILPSVQPANAGVYSVVVSNSAGQVTSSNAVLTILVPPTITNEPASLTAYAGTDAAFSVGASGSSPLAYQWLFNGINIDGATNANLLISAASPANQGAYSVLVSNSVGVASSSNAFLTVLVSLAITNQPADLTVNAGGNAVFSVGASGTPPLAYQWQFNGTNIFSATNSALTVFSAQSGDAGAYAAVVSNPAGSVTSSNANLTVIVPPIITSPPTDQTVIAGSNAVFSVSATGAPPLGYQWQFNGVNINGATNAMLTVFAAQAGDAGNYAVTVSNPAGAVTSSNALLSVIIAPSITNPPISQTVIAGSNATFNVRASGSDPLAYQWQFGGTNITDATNASFVLYSAQPSNAGPYTVIVSNPAGSATNSDAVLTVIVPPTITIPPVSLTVNLGHFAIFTVGASGTPPLAYQWLLNGTNLADATNAFLFVGAAQPGDAGVYSVIVSNPAGSVTNSDALLAVRVPPTITNQPVSHIVQAGSDAVFIVNVAGTAPLAYQWQKWGSNISGATSSSLTVSKVQPINAGNYSVLVANAAGAVTSAVATLTVIPAPPPILHGSVQKTPQGKQYVLSFAANPGQAYVVQFTDTLPNGPWTVLTNVAATETTVVCTDPITNWSKRFYRVRVASIYPEQVRLTGTQQNGQFLLAFNSTTGKTYTIQSEDAPQSWQTFTNITAASSNVSLTTPITNQQRLFRVSAPPD